MKQCARTDVFQAISEDVIYDFILKCTDEFIAYFPRCINAYMIKLEALMEKRMAIRKASGNQRSKEIFTF
jgi:hypothetical protein